MQFQISNYLVKFTNNITVVLVSVCVSCSVVVFVVFVFVVHIFVFPFRIFFSASSSLLTFCSSPSNDRI